MQLQMSSREFLVVTMLKCQLSMMRKAFMATKDTFKVTTAQMARSVEDALPHLVDVIAVTGQRLPSGEEDQMVPVHFVMPVGYTMQNSPARTP